MLQRRRDKSHCGERELVWISSAFLWHHHMSPVQHCTSGSGGVSDATSDTTQFCHKLQRAVQSCAVSSHPSRDPHLKVKETSCLFLLNTFSAKAKPWCPLCHQIPQRPLCVLTQDVSQDSDYSGNSFNRPETVLKLRKGTDNSPGTGWVSPVLAVQTSSSALPGAQPSSVLCPQTAFSHWCPSHSFLPLPAQRVQEETLSCCSKAAPDPVRTGLPRADVVSLPVGQ